MLFSCGQQHLSFANENLKTILRKLNSIFEVSHNIVLCQKKENMKAFNYCEAVVGAPKNIGGKWKRAIPKKSGHEDLKKSL